MQQVKVKVSEAGEVSLPVEFLDRLHIRGGDTVILTLDDGDIRIRTSSAAVHAAQALARELEQKYGPLPTVDEFIAERRKEAAREQAEMDEWLATPSTPRL
jgi:AbrB family looped-hinge helix DNA binding protein